MAYLEPSRLGHSVRETCPWREWEGERGDRGETLRKGGTRWKEGEEGRGKEIYGEGKREKEGGRERERGKEVRRK